MEELNKICENELLELERIAEAAEADLKNAPPGILRIIKNNNTDQYYWRTDTKDTKGTYIRKSEEKLIKALAQKDYAQKVRGILEPIIRKRRRMLSQIEKIPAEKQLLELYNQLSSARQKLITPYIYDDEAFVKQWEHEKKTLKETAGAELGTEIFTEKGECVRSKSEKILADKLYITKPCSIR